MGLEREYKFLLNAAGRAVLLNRLDWDEALIQESIFFDTGGGTLLSAGWALRLRFEAGRPPAGAEAAFPSTDPGWQKATLTLKGRTERTDALFERSEYEVDVGLKEAERLRRGGWTVSELPHGPLSDALFGLRINNAEFEPIGSFRNLRYVKRLGDAELCLDRSKAPNRGERFELELETPGGMPDAVATLLDGCECRPSPQGKFAWLLGL